MAHLSPFFARRMDTSRDWLLWDGECGLCAAAAAWVARRDRAGRLAVVPYQQAPSPPMNAALADECRRAVHLVTGRGEVLRGEEAVVSVLATLGYRRLARLAGAGPGRWLVAVAYRWVSRHRRWLSRFVGGAGERSCPMDR